MLSSAVGTGQAGCGIYEVLYSFTVCGWPIEVVALYSAMAVALCVDTVPLPVRDW